jgi:hypothetical protein
MEHNPIKPRSRPEKILEEAGRKSVLLMVL